MNYTKDEPFINGIGVLTYQLSNRTVELSEFYEAEIPELYEIVEDTEFTANGWLHGGDNIYCNISEVYNFDGYYGAPSPYLFYNKSHTPAGYCYSPIKFANNTTQYFGIVEGTITGDLTTKTCGRYYDWLTTKYYI